MPLSEAEVDELLQNLTLDENNNCTKENIIEVSQQNYNNIYLMTLIFSCSHSSWLK